jgi:hypothetical protein
MHYDCGGEGKAEGIGVRLATGAISSSRQAVQG